MFAYQVFGHFFAEHVVWMLYVCIADLVGFN